MLAGAGAAQAVPPGHNGLNARVQRTFEHRQMRAVCVFFRDWDKSTPPKTLAALLDGAPEPRLTQVAATFIELQEARHAADYDLSAEFSLSEGWRLAGLAGSACKAWREVHASPDAAVFLTALLLGERLYRRG